MTWAAERGDEAMVDLLVVNNAELDFTHYAWKVPFAISYDKGHRELAARLLEKTIGTLSEGTWASGSGWNNVLLSWAARLGRLSTVDFLLSKFESSRPLYAIKMGCCEWTYRCSGITTEERGTGYFQGIQVLLGRSGDPFGAALNGHEAIVQMLVEHGVDPNGEEAGMGHRSGLRPLGRAAMKGQVGVAKLLLRYGADPNLLPTIDEESSSSMADEDRARPPLAIAADYGHLAMVELLLANGANPSWESSSLSWLDISWGARNERSWRVPYSGGYSALSYAIGSGHKDIVRVLLKAGADAKMNDKDLPLVWAAMAEETAIAELLLENGAGFHLKSYGETPLSVASRYGNDEVVKLFIGQGADIEGKDRDGRTPLSLAKTEAVVDILINAGADLDSEDNYGRSPLCCATDLSIIKLLLEAKANVNSGRSAGMTPLITAVKQDDLEKVRLLLQNGADVNARDKHSRTSLLITAKRKGDWYYKGFEIAKLLLDHGADPEAEDRKGLTALSWAAWNGHMGAVKLLLERGASLAPFVGYKPERREQYFGWSRSSRTGSETGLAVESDPDSNWDHFDDISYF